MCFVEEDSDDDSSVSCWVHSVLVTDYLDGRQIYRYHEVSAWTMATALISPLCQQCTTHLTILDFYVFRKPLGCQNGYL